MTALRQKYLDCPACVAKLKDNVGTPCHNEHTLYIILIQRSFFARKTCMIYSSRPSHLERWKLSAFFAGSLLKPNVRSVPPLGRVWRYSMLPYGYRNWPSCDQCKTWWNVSNTGCIDSNTGWAESQATSCICLIPSPLDRHRFRWWNHNVVEAHRRLLICGLHWWLLIVYRTDLAISILTIDHWFLTPSWAWQHPKSWDCFLKDLNMWAHRDQAVEERSWSLEHLLRGEQGQDTDVIGSPEAGDPWGCNCQMGRARWATPKAYRSYICSTSWVVRWMS